MGTGTMWGCGHITNAGLPACPVCEQIGQLTRDCADLSEMVTEVAAQRDDARAEVERLRAVVGCEECGGRGWALDDASDPAECGACKTDRQALGLSAPN